MKQTLVIGSAVADVIINIPRLPKTGEDIHITRQSRSLGGCACNVSEVLRQFGVSYSLCAPVGSGIYGDFVARELEKRGVPVYVRLAEENGCCYCMVEESGERTFIVDHGAEYTFSEQYLEKIDTDAIDSVYVCGLEIEEADGWNIIRYLQKHPDYTIYFAPSSRIMEIQPDRMEAVLKLHPIVHLNEGESLAFTGEKNVEKAARAIFEKTQNTVIITRGEKGSYCYDGADHEAEAVPVTVCDTIGAGDAHMGAVIAARRLGYSFPEALRIANHVSAAVVSRAGASLEEEDFENIKKATL